MSRRAPSHKPTLLPMCAAKNRSCGDAIAHTVGHFLPLREGWNRVSLPDALEPTTARKALEGRGVDVAKFAWARERDHKHELDEECWTTHRSEVMQAHDHGYAPRYRWLARQAGDPATSARWFETEDRGTRSRARVRGFFVVVAREGDNCWRVITAHNAFTDVSTSPAQQGSTVMQAALAKAFCQKEQDDTSSSHTKRTDLRFGVQSGGDE